MVFLLLLFCTKILIAQTSAMKKIPEGFSAGSIVTTDNKFLGGYVKNNMRKKGEIIFLTTDDKKTKYTALQVLAVTIDSTNYVVANNCFYKIISTGPKINLLRKASTSSGIQYNGAEPIPVNSGEGAYDDYYIQTTGTQKLQWIPKKEFQKIFISVCSDCAMLSRDLKASKIAFGEIVQAVVLYNACNQ